MTPRSAAKNKKKKKVKKKASATKRLIELSEKQLYVMSAGLAAARERSEPLEGEVLEEPEHGPPPHQEERGLLELQDAVVDQPHGVPKRTEEVNEESLHLRLAGLEPLGVLQLLLVVAEEAFDGRSVVRVLAREDHFDAKLKDVLAHLLAAVVRRVVKQPVGVVPPVATLRGEQLGEAREEHQHDVAVGVELREAEVQLALRVNRSNHVDSVAQLLVRHGVRLAPLPPLLVAEVEVRQPRLVDVDDALALGQQREHLLGIMHAHDETALGVALVRNLLEHSVPHVEVVAKDAADASERYIELLALEQMHLDLLGRPDVLPALEVRLDLLLEALVLLLSGLPLLGKSSVGVVRESHRLDEVANERWLDVAERSRFDLADSFFEHELGNLLQLCGAEAVLRRLAPELALDADLVGELVAALLALAELLLAPSAQVHHGGRQLHWLSSVDAATDCSHGLRLLCKVGPQLGGQLGVVAELLLAQTRRLDAEPLGLLLEAVGIEDELAAEHSCLFANGLERLVVLEVLASFVDHEPLLLDQRQRLDPGPLQRVRRPAALHLFLLLVAGGRALLRRDDPVDGEPCLSHLGVALQVDAVY